MIVYNHDNKKIQWLKSVTVNVQAQDSLVTAVKI